jgi:serine/threonine protein kinase
LRRVVVGDAVDRRLSLPLNTVIDGSYRIERVVGSGGFGITYAAEDINLATRIAIKEYYPFDFGDRDATMSVRPKSERHRQTFDWGRSNFLQEARTLARFEHPSIVRVTRAFEANSTAYMVMRFEPGQSFEEWLKGLDRPPTQDELDAIVAPLLDALQMMHAADFLHRDIAPDNIIVRADGSPVLLDFGAARRAVAEMSRSLTGVVKTGYSPHEQYSSDGRLQGPWSDFYALGGTLYRAVTGRAPEEATLRFDEDHMPSAAQAAWRDRYRPGFLNGIDTCLKVRQADRPRSVAQLRPMLSAPPPRSTVPASDTRKVAPPKPARAPAAGSGTRYWWAAAAAIAVIGGVFGGIHYTGWEAKERDRVQSEARSNKVDQDLQRQADAAAAIRNAEAQAQVQARARAEADAKRGAENELRAREQAEAARRKADEDARARARAEADVKRRAEDELRAREQAEAAKRKADEEARATERAEAAAKREEELRVAALEEARHSEDEARRVAEAAIEAKRLATIPDGDMRTGFVRRVQQALKQGRCYDGALTGRSDDTQEPLNKFVAKARKRGGSSLQQIELAKASVGDFESWLKDADAIKGTLCVPPPERAAPVEKKVPVANSPSRPAGADRPRRAEGNAGGGQSGGEGMVRCWNGRVATSRIGCRNGTQ